MFRWMRQHHSPATIRLALGIVADGGSHREASEATGVAIETLRTWLYTRAPKRAHLELDTFESCTRCGAPLHDFAVLPAQPYAYLLAVYLGDGNIFGGRKGIFTLRVTLDELYPGIIDECVAAMTLIRDGRPPRVRPDSRGKRCVYVEALWKQWPSTAPAASTTARSCSSRGSRRWCTRPRRPSCAG